MDEKLTMSDGTEVAGHILPNGDNRLIFVYLDGMSIIDGFALFSDPEKTKVIIARRYGTEKTYEGYTQLSSISDEYGNCNITMKRGDLNVEP